MKLLNRSALMLLPLSPYLAWVNSLPVEVSELEQPLTEQALAAEGRVYLIAEFDSHLGFDPEAEPDQVLDDALAGEWQALFENELAAWDELGLHWPQPLTRALLQQWFKIKPLALAFDADSKPLLTAVL